MDGTDLSRQIVDILAKRPSDHEEILAALEKTNGPMDEKKAKLAHIAMLELVNRRLAAFTDDNKLRLVGWGATHIDGRTK